MRVQYSYCLTCDIIKIILYIYIYIYKIIVYFPWLINKRILSDQTLTKNGYFVECSLKLLPQQKATQLIYIPIKFASIKLCIMTAKPNLSARQRSIWVPGKTQSECHAKPKQKAIVDVFVSVAPPGGVPNTLFSDKKNVFFFLSYRNMYHSKTGYRVRIYLKYGATQCLIC